MSFQQVSLKYARCKMIGLLKLKYIFTLTIRINTIYNLQIMKNIFFIVTVFILASCTPKNSITLTGKITNPDSDVILLDIPHDYSKDTIATLAEDGTFLCKVDIKEAHMANFINGKAYLQLYLVPGAELNIQFDGIQLKDEKLDEAELTGKKSESSNLLLNIRKIKPEEGLKALLALPAPEFEDKVTKNAQAINEKINKYESNYPNQKNFISLVRINQDVQLAQKYDYFVMYHSRFSPNDTIPVPEKFASFSDAIALDNYDAFKEIRPYQYFVVQKLTSNLSSDIEASGLKRNTSAYTNKQFDAITALEVPQEVKDEMGNRMLGSYTYTSDSVKTIMRNRYKEIIANPKYIAEFESLLAKLDKLTPSAIAPTFAYNDIDGNMVKSEDLKGKVIYIDVWATWCGPCKGEIPYLKTLEEELHTEDIAFVSISVDNDKAAWEKMVKEKELKGYQLFAPKAWESSIIKDYAIRGIPRFIIIDKEGKLVDANASRPSNPETKDKLLKLAKS